MNYRKSLEDIECHFKWEPCKDDIDASPDECIKHMTSNLNGGCYPSEEAANLLIGYLYTQSETPNYSEAIKLFDEIIAISISNGSEKEETMGYKLVADANKMHALLLQNQTEVDRMVKLLQTVLEEHRKTVSDKTLAAIKATKAFSFSYFGGDNYKESLELYSEAIDLDPTNAKYLIGHAFIAGRIRRKKPNSLTLSTVLEESQLCKAIQLTNAEQSLPLTLLADILCRKAKKPIDHAMFAEALELYDKAYNLNPDSPNVLKRCGTGYCTLGKMQEGLVCLTKAVELAPTSADSRFRLARWYEKNWHTKEELDLAIEHMKEAVTVGRRRRFWAEMSLGRLLKRRDPKFNRKQFLHDMKAQYEDDETFLQLIDTEINRLESIKKIYNERKRQEFPFNLGELQEALPD